MLFCKSNNNRICLFDNLRFFLILLVVIGHFVDMNIAQSKLFKSIYVCIYSFHMPLFLFLSGVFHKNTHILSKALVYIFIGFLWKIIVFLEEIFLFGDSLFSLLSDSNIPWYMFVLAAYMLISYFLSKINKKFILALAIMIACFVGYDSNIGDFLYLSRAIIFYPFFILGEMVDPQILLTITRNKWLRISSFLILLIWVLLCLFQLDHIYILRPLFTGRNPFSVNELFMKWGFAFRLFCYIISLLTGLSVICIMTDKYLPIITFFGSRTLQVYFWHYFVINLLVKSQINTLLMATPTKKLLWISFAIILTFILSLKPFAFPIMQIMKSCKYIDTNHTEDVKP